MDEDQEGGRAQPRFALLSLLPDDPRARSLGKGSGGANHGEGVPQGERQRPVSGQRSADHVCCATSHREGDR